MKKARGLIVMGIAAAFIVASVAGFTGQGWCAEHPKADHPAAVVPKVEHPSAEQINAEPPKVEHPKADDIKVEPPKVEHPKSEHPKADIRRSILDDA